jgi:ribosomal-protein-alanine N-acetyltransferase
VNAECLETERLVLEPLVEAHAAELFDGLSDFELYRFIPQDPPTEMSSLRDRFRRLESRRSPSGEERWLNWAARLRDEGSLVGRFEATVRADRTASIAYLVLRRHWRRGYGQEATRAVILELRRSYAAGLVQAEVDTRNAGSTRLLESLGFERTEVVRGADTFKGAVSDEFRYQLRGAPSPLAPAARPRPIVR